MLKLAALLEQEAVVEVEYDGQTVPIRFKPGVYTAKFALRLPELNVNDALAEIALNTGVEGDDGQEVPATVEGWGTLPNWYNRTVLRAVLGAHAPNPTTGSSSDTSW